MNLEQLTNAELIERFDKLDHRNYVLKNQSQTVPIAYLAIDNLPGVQDVDNSRQTIIDFIREQESLQQPKSIRRTEGGRRKSIKRRKGKGRKSIKRRKGKGRK
jgi:hypothetical protein